MRIAHFDATGIEYDGEKYHQVAIDILKRLSGGRMIGCFQSLCRLRPRSIAG